MPNRLADSLSPYLRQHADNPVDWWEWSPEALAEAARRNVPIFLSVGYAACHWCHVMAHESFEDDGIAALLNANFVAIKVDREERPDIDAVYMNATTAMTGHGGWPMTCLLTPAGEPFFAGTYLPRPQLAQLLNAAHDAWTTRQDEVTTSAGQIAEQLRAYSVPTAAGNLTSADLDQAAAQLRTEFDLARGGFGGAPKFPPSMVLEFLLRQWARTDSADSAAMVTGTCEAMARGGMYDQLGGGFARYSVDASWVVPHFEKMLYDNAQLLAVYAHWWRKTKSPLAQRVCAETAEFIMSGLGTPEGGFASALDADTDGVEGLTYAWTPAQLREVLGDDDGAYAAAIFGVTETGTFEHGTSTLQLRVDPDYPQRFSHVRDRLFAARNQRPQPERDDKVVTSWNGLAISALTEAAAIFDNPEWLQAAIDCARFITATHLVDGELRRTSRGGQVSAAPAVADDYGNLAAGLLTLHQLTADPQWLTVATQLLDTAVEYFSADDGGFFDTHTHAEALFSRPRGRGDNAEPCGTSALAGALLMSAAVQDAPAHRAAAEQAVAAMSAVAIRDPRFAGWALATAEALHAGPVQVAIVGDDDNVLTAVARQSCSPGMVLVAGAGNQPGVPLLQDRVVTAPTAFVCRGFVCDAPITDVDALASALGVETQ